jgi:hypothetical protein
MRLDCSRACLAWPGPELCEFLGSRLRCFSLSAAEIRKSTQMVSRLSGRESIFLISHTNEFCGKSKVAREAVEACMRQEDGRTTYEECPPCWQGVPSAVQGWQKVNFC